MSIFLSFACLRLSALIPMGGSVESQSRTYRQVTAEKKITRCVHPQVKHSLSAKQYMNEGMVIGPFWVCLHYKCKSLIQTKMLSFTINKPKYNLHGFTWTLSNRVEPKILNIGGRVVYISLSIHL